MSADKQAKILLRKYAVGEPTADLFEYVEAGDIPQAANDGEMVIKTTHLSVDPYMRGRLTEGRKSYIGSFVLNEPPSGGAVGVVLSSKKKGFAEGDVVTGYWNWEKYVLVTADSKLPIFPFNQPVKLGIDPSHAIGACGMPGLTAYLGFLEICKPKEGEQVLVTGAAGAVGSLVGQIAKIKGCRVVGVAGSDEKCAWLKTIGFDETINYKKTDDMKKALTDAFPKGIDCFFDNVGGTIFDDALDVMNVKGRASICGAISTYNATSIPQGPRPNGNIISKGLLLQGFIISRDFSLEQRMAGQAQLVGWAAEGKIKMQQTFREGLQSMGTAFVEMMKGANTGKMVVKL